LGNEAQLHHLAAAFSAASGESLAAQPLAGSGHDGGRGRPRAESRRSFGPVGSVREATAGEVDIARQRAVAVCFALGCRAAGRARPPLENAADRLETDRARLMGVLVREAGKFRGQRLGGGAGGGRLPALLRRAVKEHFDPATHVALGPWSASARELSARHLPGQIAAALAAGNWCWRSRGADAADRGEAVRVLWAAGIPATRCSLPGDGATVGARL
jgi:RHH-type proline utilization regulon transcriptional repressor/proline dehydrogenase/delta 1-pyrroline-5-carboxylate dehydrogenase